MCTEEKDVTNVLPEEDMGQLSPDDAEKKEAVENA